MFKAHYKCQVIIIIIIIIIINILTKTTKKTLKNNDFHSKNTSYAKTAIFPKKRNFSA